MTLIHGDCLDVMAGMDPESVDAIVTDPPYGLEFMGKDWDKIGRNGPASFENLGKAKFKRRDTRPGRTVMADFEVGEGPWGNKPRFSTLTRESMLAAQQWHARWAEAAYRVAKPSAYLLAFGGTRTVHRMTCALEDAGWIIRDMLVWGYASGFPKSKASLKPAWEPIVMARKPGPLRMLAIDECRIPTEDERARTNHTTSMFNARNSTPYVDPGGDGRWPANIVLTDPIFDGGIEGVVGGGTVSSGVGIVGHGAGKPSDPSAYATNGTIVSSYGDTGTYSRFFLIPKAARSDREPVLGIGDERANVHPTVKPVDLMRHLVRLVTPTGGTVLDPFLGSGTTGLAAEMEGFEWIGIEREAEYVAIAEARLNGTQRGLGLEIA